MAGSLTSRTLARPSFEIAFDGPAFVRAMLEFESALAEAQAGEGLIPGDAAKTIARACASMRIDVDALVAEAKQSATLAVPLVRLLKAEVARVSKDHATHVHFGATSQDVLDTAMALCLKPCLEEADRALEATMRHRLALRLGLADARAWQSHRNAWIDLLDRIGQAVLTAGKIARDVSLLAQPEVGEMQEAPPRDGVGLSSAMPHKRNPVARVHALAAATAMPGLLATLHAAGLAEHERALGGWQAELAIVPGIAAALGTSLDFLETIAASLVVNAQRMKENLEAYGEGNVAAGFDTALDELLGHLSPYPS